MNTPDENPPIETLDAQPSTPEGTPTLEEVKGIVINAVRERAPTLEAEAMAIIEEEGGTDMDDLISAVAILLEEHRVDTSFLTDLFGNSEPMPPEPPREKDPADLVSESGESIQRQRFATACKDLLPADECTALLSCGFYAPEEGEPFEYSIYRVVVQMVARMHVLPTMDQSALDSAKKKDRPRIKRELESQSLQTAIKLLAERGIENPGVEF